MVLSKLSLMATLGSVSLASLAYLLYMKTCYGYLSSLGYDHPPPRFILGNLAEFSSAENSTTSSSPVSHYSKTLQRWTRTYGKIYGYYEGHSAVLVLADADLVGEVFLGQNKLHAHRRSFPMSKPSGDANADVFLSNGIKWLRMRYGLEKVMLNSKNVARCLAYLNESFSVVFSAKNTTDTNSRFDMYKHAKLLMIESMFMVVFGTSLNEFANQEPRVSTALCESARDGRELLHDATSDLFHARLVAHKFHDAFLDYESFSVLKFMAMMVPELSAVWRMVEKCKRLINAHVYRFECLADPMDFFYESFIFKYLL
jgi:hypothetical protein